MAGNGKPPERRTERREMHVDRRKSMADLVERIVPGVRESPLRRKKGDDRPPSSRRRK
jgi:hypothetical protein